MASQTDRKPARKPSIKRSSTKANPVAKKPSPIAPKKLTPIVKVLPKKATQTKLALKKNEAKAPPKAKAIVADKATVVKVKKLKLVRDSFTIPKDEYVALQKLKERAIKLTKPAKKGELLRAGLFALSHMQDTAFLATLAAIPALKTGRPKGAKILKK
jgi:hypothetical protein